MIVSFSNNYIFIRTKKTASSTIEGVLSEHLQDGDIIAGARSSRISPPPSLQAQTDQDIYAHMKAARIRALVPPDFWQKAFKFTSERHPYEKAVSLAFYRFGKRDRIEAKKRTVVSEEFPAVLEETVRGRSYRGFGFYTIDGEVVVDDFIRHEQLRVDLERVASRLRIPLPDELPRSKSSYKFDPRPAAEILSEEQKQTIYSTCREEFELLGYKQ